MIKWLNSLTAMTQWGNVEKQPNYEKQQRIKIIFYIDLENSHIEDI